MTIYNYLCPPPKKRISIDRFLDKALPGDIILMSSCSFGAFMQEGFTGGAYSHVGVVCWMYDGKKKTVCIAESTFAERDIVDFLTGEVKEGPMIVSARKRLKTYCKHTGIRMVWRPMNPDHRDYNHQLNHDIWKIMSEKKKFGFPTTYTDYIKLTAAAAPDVEVAPFCWLSPSLHSKEDEEEDEGHKTQFCSSLLAEIYDRSGLLEITRDYDHYAPTHFSLKHQQLRLRLGVTFGEEFIIYSK
jgi:hypothetical protein